MFVMDDEGIGSSLTTFGDSNLRTWFSWIACPTTKLPNGLE
jgi:hypothetical protein